MVQMVAYFLSMEGVPGSIPGKSTLLTNFAHRPKLVRELAENSKLNKTFLQSNAYSTLFFSHSTLLPSSCLLLILHHTLNPLLHHPILFILARHPSHHHIQALEVTSNLQRPVLPSPLPTSLARFRASNAVVESVKH